MRIKRDDHAKNHVFTHIKGENARTLRFLTKAIGVEIPSVTSRQVKMALHVIDDDCLLVKIPTLADLDVVESPKSMEKRPSWMAATRGLSGAEASIALDVTRYGSVSRAVKTEQLVTLLRNAGHRIEKISQRLYRVDDDVRSLSDLAEMAHKLDSSSVLIAESA